MNARQERVKLTTEQRKERIQIRQAVREGKTMEEAFAGMEEAGCERETLDSTYRECITKKRKEARTNGLASITIGLACLGGGLGPAIPSLLRGEEGFWFPYVVVVGAAAFLIGLAQVVCGNDFGLRPISWILPAEDR